MKTSTGTRERGRKHCPCGAVMAQGPKAGKKGAATVPYCPFRHKKKGRSKASPRTKEDQIKAMTPAERKARRASLRGAHRHEAPKQRGGLRRQIAQRLKGR